MQGLPIPTDERGQAHMLEALTASFIVMAAVVFAIQATAITPLTISTAHQHVETQERIQADGMLSAADKDDSLEHQLLYWDRQNETFVNATKDGYTNPPNTEFGQKIDRLFISDGLAVNAHVTYTDKNGFSDTETIMYQGEPSTKAVSASYTVVLYDDMQLTGGPNEPTLKEADSFYIPDAAANSPVYNVVSVRLVIWKM